MSQPPPDEPVPPVYYGPPAYPPGFQPPTYESSNQPGYYPPPGYGQPPPYGQPPAYGTYAAYGQPPVSGPVPEPAARHRGLWITAIVVAVLLVAGGVVFAVSRSSGSKSARATAATVTVPDGPGVVYRSTQGHFAARFPAAPDAHNLDGEQYNVAYKVYVAADTESHTVVEAAGFSESMPSSAQEQILDGIVEGASRSSGLTAGAQVDTTFQGHKARRTELTQDGTTISVLAFIYSAQRIYILLAPAGDGMKNLETSFVTVP